MRRIHFHLGIGYANVACDEIIEFEDDATEEEIGEEFEYWVHEQEDASWWEEE